VGDTLSLLWAARRGLTESELLDALGKKNPQGEDEPLPRAQWSPLFLAMSDALISRGGLLTFAHDFLRTAAEDAYLPTAQNQQQAHLRLADYFERQPASPRRTDELPWLLAEAGEWQRLQTHLVDGGFFAEAWQRNEFDVKTDWTQIEAGSNLRMVEAYLPQVEAPETELDKDYLWRLGFLLGDTGHPEEALTLRASLVDHFRATGDLNELHGALGNQAVILRARGDLDGAMVLHKEQERICRQLGNLAGLQTTLGNQALILKDRGDLDGAMALHEEEERICRQLGNLDGLQATFGNQALILKARGDLDGAMALHKKKERICRQLGNFEGLAISLANQAVVLTQGGEAGEGLSLLEEAHRLASRYGYAALAGQIEPILNSARQAAQSGSSGQNVAGVPVSSPSSPAAHPRELTISQLRDSAATALKRGLWEAAATYLEKLLQQGEPVETVAPDLITALLNSHETPISASVARIETLLAQLDAASHTALAAPLREKFSAKLAASQPKKQWWRFS
jgi:tetratricopeptide (TPR) repeat protein